MSPWALNIGEPGDREIVMESGPTFLTSSTHVKDRHGEMISHIYRDMGDGKRRTIKTMPTVLHNAEQAHQRGIAVGM